jgi:hypothetical protein
MGEKKPSVDRLNDEVDSCFRLWRKLCSSAIFLVLIVLATGVFFFVGWIQRGSTIKNLRAESQELKRDIRQVESENNGLREIVAPLIGRAFSEFPGEEISSALKKIIARLEHQDALRRPIVFALALVEIVVESDVNVDIHHMEDGGHLAFCRGHETLLDMSAKDSYAGRMSETRIRYSALFEMPAMDSAAGKPIMFIGDAEYLQISFVTIPENAWVKEGKAIVIINALHRFEFQVPAQKMQADKIYVQGIRNLVGLSEEIKGQTRTSVSSNDEMDEIYTKGEIEEVVSRHFNRAFRAEVRGPLSIEQVEQESLKSILVAIKENVRQDIPQVPFGFMNDRWKDFKQQLRNGDLIFHFISDKDSWDVLCGRAGYVLVRDGEVVDTITTSGN